MSSAGPSPTAMLNRILITSTYRTLLRSAIRIDNNPSLRASVLSLSFLADGNQSASNAASTTNKVPGSHPTTGSASKGSKGSPFAGASLEDFLLELNAGTEMYLQDPSMAVTLEALTADFIKSSESSNMTVSDYYVFHYLRKRIGMLRKPLPIAARPYPAIQQTSTTPATTKKSKKSKGTNNSISSPHYELSPSFAHYVALGVDPSSMIVFPQPPTTQNKDGAVHYMPPEVVSSLRFIFRTLPFSMQQLNVAFSIVKYLSFLGKIVNTNQSKIYMLPNVFPENPALLSASTRVGQTSQLLEELLKTEGVCNYNLVKEGDVTYVTPTGISSTQSNFTRFGGIKVRPVVVPNATNKDFMTGGPPPPPSPDSSSPDTQPSSTADPSQSPSSEVGMQLLVAHPLMLEYFANTIIVMGYIQNFTLQGAVTRRFRNQNLKKKEFGLKLSKIAKGNPDLAEELKNLGSQIDAANHVTSAPEEATIEDETLKKKLTGVCVGFVINKPFCGADGMPLPLWSVIPITEEPAATTNTAQSTAVSRALSEDGPTATADDAEGAPSHPPAQGKDTHINQLFAKYLQHNIVFLGGPVMGPDSDIPDPDVPPPHDGGNPVHPPNPRRGSSYTQNALFLIHPFKSVRGASKIAGSHSPSSCNRHTDGLYLSGNFGDLFELFERGEAKPEDVMVILGYSSWGEGQLDNEIRKMGSWITLERKVEFAEQQQHLADEKKKDNTVMSNADFILSYNQVATDYDNLLPRRGGVVPIGGYASAPTVNSAPSSGNTESNNNASHGILPSEAPEIISGDALVTRQKTEAAPISHWKELMNALGPQYRKMSAMGGVDVFNGMVRSYFDPKGTPRGA